MAATATVSPPVQTPAITALHSQPAEPLPEIQKPASGVPQSERQPGDQKPQESLGQVDAIALQLREKMEDKTQGKQTGMKRPGSRILMKKPAAKTSSCQNKKPVAKAILKKPAASPKINDVKYEKPPKALKMYPQGCSKCRYKPGCTPSCFKYRGEW